MTTNRSLRVLLASLLALLALIPGSAAFAAPPEFETVDIEVTVPVEGCAFPVELHITGTGKVSTHVDHDGNLAMEIIRFIRGQAPSRTWLQGPRLRV